MHGRQRRRYGQRHGRATVGLQRHGRAAVADDCGGRPREPAGEQVPGRYRCQLGQRHAVADLGVHGRPEPEVDRTLTVRPPGAPAPPRARPEPEFLEDLK